MVPFSVMFTVEAESLEEAEAAVATWVVTPGTTLLSLMGSVMSQTTPLSIADGGAVSSGTQKRPPELPTDMAPVPLPAEPEPEPE
jgi:hypothetical protein